jgi:hypothetical protein
MISDDHNNNNDDDDDGDDDDVNDVYYDGYSTMCESIYRLVELF